MSREVRIQMTDEEQAQALAEQVNSYSSQSGLRAEFRGGALTIAPVNPLIQDLMAGATMALQWVRSRLASRSDDASDLGHRDLPQAR